MANRIWKELTPVEVAESFLLLLNLAIVFLAGEENRENARKLR